jgi:hypothetical protein
VRGSDETALPIPRKPPGVDAAFENLDLRETLGLELFRPTGG